MYAVITVSDEREVVPVALGTSRHDAMALAARHIMQTHGPSWPDILTAFQADVYEQVVALWNQSRHQFPDDVEYQVLDFSAVADALAERLDADEGS